MVATFYRGMKKLIPLLASVVECMVNHHGLCEAVLPTLASSPWREARGRAGRKELECNNPEIQYRFAELEERSSSSKMTIESTCVEQETLWGEKWCDREKQVCKLVAAGQQEYRVQSQSNNLSE